MHILVTNLSEQVMTSDLVTLFSAFGLVTFATVIRDKKSGRSKGNAFLEMPQEAQAEQAIKGLQDWVVCGRKMAVQKLEYRAGEFNN